MQETVISRPDPSRIVTATGYVAYLDAADDLEGPYFRTARQTNGGSPAYDYSSGSYAQNIGAASSTSVSATYSWSITANTVYNFGCTFLSRPTNWSTEMGRCRVTWVCTEN